MHVDEPVDRCAGNCPDASEHEYLLPGREAGAEIGYLGIEDFGGLRVVVQLENHGMIAYLQNSTPYLDTIDFLNCNEVTDAALEHLDVYGARIEWLWIG